MIAMGAGAAGYDGPAVHPRKLERRAEELSRGGGAASGIFGTTNGFSTPARRFSSLSLMPVPARPA